MINWPTVFVTLAIAQAIRLIEIVAEWWYTERRGKRARRR